MQTIAKIILSAAILISVSASAQDSTLQITVNGCICAPGYVENGAKKGYGITISDKNGKEVAKNRLLSDASGCKILQSRQDVLDKCGPTDTEATYGLRKSSNGAEGGYQVSIHAAKCRESVGDPPSFSLMALADVPLNDFEKGPKGSCRHANPSYVSGRIADCNVNESAKIGVFTTQLGKAKIRWAILGRGIDKTATFPNFSIGMIGYNELSGETCFFNTVRTEDSQCDNVDCARDETAIMKKYLGDAKLNFPWLKKPDSSKSNWREIADAEVIWGDLGFASTRDCAYCHTSGPFVRSPFIENWNEKLQYDPQKSYKIITPKDRDFFAVAGPEPRAIYSKFFGKSLQLPAKNECAACHDGTTTSKFTYPGCGNLVPLASGLMRYVDDSTILPGRLHDAAKAGGKRHLELYHDRFLSIRNRFPKEHVPTVDKNKIVSSSFFWMPPQGYKKHLEKWDCTYLESALQAAECCVNPEGNGCIWEKNPTLEHQFY